MKISERVESLPEWGVDPIPVEHRRLTAFDSAILWGDLGIGMLVLVTGALLVPGLGFATAMVAIVVGSVVGVALLALASTAGAQHGVPTMVLFRPVLGIRGSWLPSVLNGAQLIGWTAVEFWAMSFVADLVSQRVFGFSARLLWLGIAAVVCTGLALWGPVDVARVWMKRFGAWVVVAICGLVTILVVFSDALSQALAAPGVGGFPTFGAALDLVIAMPISWLPLVADYSRFSTRPRSAFYGTFGGYLLANVWLYTLGVLLVLGTDASPDPAGIAAGILALAGGSVAGLLFLVALLVGETDEAFADIYSGAVSLQNIWPRASQRSLAIAIAAVAAALAAWLTMERYEAFLLLLGSVFVPLFGILAADHFFNRRGYIDMVELYRPRGSYWFSNGFRLRAFVPWIAGFLVYHWVLPTGPAWWLDGVSGVLGTPLNERLPWLSASLLSFSAAFLLALRGRAYHRPVESSKERHEDRGHV
ncbi:MAG TPA: cytosine permease [Actinomycetota bacterium]|nr:cytosine permease [Actinomycetota bacterium]